MLFGVESSEPSILLGAAVVIAVIIMVGATVPARRAARVDPLVALRYE
jgi:putative ABC transport system permease protein